jgi:ribosome maturation factor RimP
VATGLPSQKQVIELLDDEFARQGYEIEDVVVREAARPPKITIIADGDKPLDLDAIAMLAQSASKLLDTADTAVGRYVLEVSSPGVDRPLTSEKHFRRARGRKVEVALADGRQLTGRLGGTADGHLRLVVRPLDGKDWSVHEIPIDEVVKAVVQVEFSPPHPRELELAGDSDGKAGT